MIKKIEISNGLLVREIALDEQNKTIGIRFEGSDFIWQELDEENYERLEKLFEEVQ